ncbi:hypothetical protein B0H14DRAFT_2660746 [Mycena olivaceomarginata]|nr:hypothetical protein B0H14DRAFT_2660746 [Mycena olivaceomarginata]
MAQQNGRRIFKTIMKSHRVRIPKYEHLPIRLRPWFLLFTTLVMFVLAFLGFTNFSRSLPLNDKALHFLCFGLATGDQRRVWFWRNSALIITGFVCFFCGGILSEFVQSMLPANLLGSSVGLFASYHMERYYRKRREVRLLNQPLIFITHPSQIARLYQPLDAGSMSDLEDEDDGVQLLPTHAAAPKGGQKGVTRLTDVWDEREELFDIGGDSEDEDPLTPRLVRAPAPQHPAPNEPSVPKIFVTGD